MTEVELALAQLQNDAETWARIKQYVEITPKGLLPRTDDPMPIELYGFLCGVIGVGRQALRWAVGDALNYGERHYHEDYEQFTDLLGCSYHTLQQYRRVAARIPYEDRDNDINWTAYQITAHLEPETRDDLLEAYTSGEIEDTTELRDTVRAMNTGPECELLPPCPKCGGKLTSHKCKGCGLDFPAAVHWLVDLLKEEGE